VLFGDIEGSMDLMNLAYQSTPPSEVEDAAWIVTQMAHLDLSIGKIDEAEKLSQQALLMFPGYHYALGNLAKVRIQQKRYDEAVELLRQRYQAAPHAEIFSTWRVRCSGLDTGKKRRQPSLNLNRNRYWKRIEQTIPIMN
jgi:tetratricopeptide (TPR) repeat protein